MPIANSAAARALPINGFYQGEDHLLVVDGVIQESYRRFYYKDIRAIFMGKSVRGAIYNLILGLIGLTLGMIALGGTTGAVVYGRNFLWILYIDHARQLSQGPHLPVLHRHCGTDLSYRFFGTPGQGTSRHCQNHAPDSDRANGSVGRVSRCLRTSATARLPLGPHLWRSRYDVTGPKPLLTIIGSREAVARCPQCHRTFCRECICDHEGKALCSDCLVESQLSRPRPYGPLAPRAATSGPEPCWDWDSVGFCSTCSPPCC